MAGALLLVAVGVLIWLLFFRKTGRRRRKYRHHHHRSRSPHLSLAQTGGLPPIRPEEKFPGPPPPPSEP